MPSWDIFEQQTQEYRDSVLPPRRRRRASRSSRPRRFGWERYVGHAGRVIGMQTFGASAPLKELQKKFGFEPEQRGRARARKLLGVERPRAMAPLLDAPDARTLVAGDLGAVFLPAHGMLGASLRHRGVELLRRVDDLDERRGDGQHRRHPAAASVGEPARRRSRYRAAGRDVVLDRVSPLLHRDAQRAADPRRAVVAARVGR